MTRHDLQAEGEAEALRYLEKEAKAPRGHDIPVSLLVRSGDPPVEIIAAADSGADAIVKARNRAAELNRLMFGSVAERVLHSSTRPVILVRAA